MVREREVSPVKLAHPLDVVKEDSLTPQGARVLSYGKAASVRVVRGGHRDHLCMSPSFAF